MLFAEPLIGVFTADPAVRALGADCLRIVSYGYAAYAWGMVMVQAFNGAGDTVTPTWINLFCYWLFQIPLAWTSGALLGPGAARACTGPSPSRRRVIAVVAILVFRRGAWKTRMV